MSVTGKWIFASHKAKSYKFIEPGRFVHLNDPGFKTFSVSRSLNCFGRGQDRKMVSLGMRSPDVVPVNQTFLILSRAEAWSAGGSFLVRLCLYLFSASYGCFWIEVAVD